MRTVAIVLGDNDFIHTFIPLLEGIKAILMDRPDELNQDDIRKIVSRGIMFYYLAYQHRFRLEDEFYSSDARLLELEKYLSKAKVLFDEEAEADISTKDHDGGAWYLELQSGIVRGY